MPWAVSAAVRAAMHLEFSERFVSIVVMVLLIEEMDSLRPVICCCIASIEVTELAMFSLTDFTV